MLEQINSPEDVNTKAKTRISKRNKKIYNRSCIKKWRTLSLKLGSSGANNSITFCI